MNIVFEAGKAITAVGGLTGSLYLAKVKYDKMKQKLAASGVKQQRRDWVRQDDAPLSLLYSRGWSDQAGAEGALPLLLLRRGQDDGQPHSETAAAALAARKISPATAKEVVTALKAVQLTAGITAVPIALWNIRQKRFFD
ncbi:hypothetical protein OC834_004504 [Tilletia horrida]|uniref:Uncharacterized protein n=1 Tax=Tilletia horrida TaxID=155126 RepID=A0AAN6JPB3_9BASI|nr:hypothetical protein OC842_005470 [Tilletia horrida]KAK0527232.1 hypothetical protein OC834_004504 [Tilletia horrida]KAK0561066.1 hypothetical protein OC844_003413 [Tilletia horrida]